MKAEAPAKSGTLRAGPETEWRCGDRPQSYRVEGSTVCSFLTYQSGRAVAQALPLGHLFKSVCNGLKGPVRPRAPSTHPRKMHFSFARRSFSKRQISRMDLVKPQKPEMIHRGSLPIYSRVRITIFRIVKYRRSGEWFEVLTFLHNNRCPVSRPIPCSITGLEVKTT